MNDQSQMENPSLEQLVGQAAGDFSDRLQRGEQPDVDEYVRRYPEIADALRQVLPALQVMNSAADAPELLAASNSNAAAPKPEEDDGSSRFPTWPALAPTAPSSSPARRKTPTATTTTQH